MAHVLPETVKLFNGDTAILDHSTDYTEDPLPGEMKPPSGQIYAYYMVGEKLCRVPISTKQAKYAPALLPGVIATLLIKVS